jgi:hypothetical protein
VVMLAQMDLGLGVSSNDGQSAVARAEGL